MLIFLLLFCCYVLSGPQEVFKLKPQSFFIAFHCASFKALLQLTIVAGINEIKCLYIKNTQNQDVITDLPTLKHCL